MPHLYPNLETLLLAPKFTICILILQYENDLIRYTNTFELWEIKITLIIIFDTTFSEITFKKEAESSIESASSFFFTDSPYTSNESTSR